ncbi:capsular polysaccharide export protein [Sphingomonas gellani]|uniref:Capsular polysaccharide export protein n=1 Tax=Sphingomonas gellani TaxID=1166340 RepID=A0A1H8I867_9SPHN|nr:beta-3-deoxy-D-manno-oct-2-ulosonic acid transferase [Sphingomonas gellani]SEN64541.1 capsular polysaccharide export protein [Sphingomonas gellani]
MDSDGPAPTELLRAPPFPGASLALSKSGTMLVVDDGVKEEGVVDHLFAALRRERVGGAFWKRAAPPGDWRVVVRARSGADIERLGTGLDAGLDRAERSATLWLLPPALADRPDGGTVTVCDIDPWSLLTPETRLFAHGGDEWVALGAIVGCAVQVLSPGCYGEPGMDAPTLSRHVAARLLGTAYHDPISGQRASVDTIIARLGHWRRIIEANSGIVAACGMSWWKRHEIARFLWSPGPPLRFFRSERRAIAYAARQSGAVAVWPSRVSVGMAARAEAKGVSLIRVEDGFVRSIGLGSDLVPPSSVTVDRLGIHYDPVRASDLEVLLGHAPFPPAMLERAGRLRVRIVESGISKYGGDRAHAFPSRRPGVRLVLVPGQVEDDMSVRLGGGGLSSNLDLLRRARALEPEAEIWFRPHPDVDAGHRKGAVRDADALGPADRIVRGGSMAELLQRIDGVHVLTSLTGFEALLRGVDVTCHGMPFYAGWGLTRDMMPAPTRRGRQLTLDQLVAGVLILYPRYLDPVSGLPCEPETLIARMVAGDAVNRLGWVTRLRRWQGWLKRAAR